METNHESVREIIETVLRVARLGEVDHFGWWGTHSFGAAGRVVLGQRLPRTWRMAAVELDIAAAANRHNEIIDRRNAVHLFSDNWPVRRWANAWVSEQKTVETPPDLFQQLERASVDDMISSLPETRSRRPSTSGQAVRIGSVSRSDFETPESLAAKVRDLAAVYPFLRDEFAVPYLEVDE